MENKSLFEQYLNKKTKGELAFVKYPKLLSHLGKIDFAILDAFVELLERKDTLYKDYKEGISTREIVNYLKKEVGLKISSKWVSKILISLFNDGLIKRPTGTIKGRWDLDDIVYRTIKLIIGDQMKLRAYGSKIKYSFKKEITTTIPSTNFFSSIKLINLFDHLNNFMGLEIFDWKFYKKRLNSISFSFIKLFEVAKIIISFIERENTIIIKFEIEISETNELIRMNGTSIIDSNNKKFYSFLDYLKQTKNKNKNSVLNEFCEHIFWTNIFHINNILKGIYGNFDYVIKKAEI